MNYEFTTLVEADDSFYGRVFSVNMHTTKVMAGGRYPVTTWLPYGITQVTFSAGQEVEFDCRLDSLATAYIRAKFLLMNREKP